MPRFAALIPAALLAFAVLVAPAPAQDEPANPFDGFVDDLIDDLLGDWGVDGPSLLGNEYFEVVHDRAGLYLPAALADGDVRVRNTVGMLKLGDTWAQAAKKAGLDLIDGAVDLGAFELDEPDRKQIKKVKSEVLDAVRISNDLRAGMAETGKLRAKAMLKVQNRVLTRFLREGDRTGLGWIFYTTNSSAVMVELKDKRIDAEVLSDEFEARYSGPDTKHSRRARRLLDKAVDLLRDLEEQPPLLLTQWDIVGSKVDSANALPPGKTRNGILKDAKRREKAHKKGWSELLNDLFFADELLDKAEKAVEKAYDNAPPPSDEEMPSWFPANVEPGDYYAFLLVNNGSSTGYIPLGWRYARVGDGRETIDSRQALWERMRTIVTDAESNFISTFRDLFYSGLGYDKRGVPVGIGTFVTIDEFFAENAQAVADADHAVWSFQDQISYPEWDGYLGTRNYQDEKGVTTARIVVAFLHARTPPIAKALQDVVTPGEYQIYRALVLGPLVNGEVILPVRKVRITEAVQLVDEIEAERAALRVTFADTFTPYVAPEDVAEIQLRQQSLLDCGPSTSSVPMLDTVRAPLYLSFDRWSCEPTTEDPYPRAFNLTIGFERIGE